MGLPTKPSLDLTVNLGHLLIMFGIVTSSIMLQVGAVTRNNEQDLRLHWLEVSMAKVGAVIDTIPDIRRDVAIIRERLGQNKPDVARPTGGP